MSDIQSLTEFRQNANAIIKRVNETDNVLYITHNGKAAAVVVSPHRWEQVQESLNLLRMLNLREKEADAGSVVDFDDAMDKVDAMIREPDGK